MSLSRQRTLVVMKWMLSSLALATALKTLRYEYLVSVLIDLVNQLNLSSRFKAKEWSSTITKLSSLHFIELGKLWSCCLAVLLISFHLRYGHQTEQTWTPLYTKFVLLKSGIISHTTSLTKPSRNSMFDWRRVLVNKVAVSQICVTRSDVHIENISVSMPGFKRLYLITVPGILLKLARFMQNNSQLMWRKRYQRAS